MGSDEVVLELQPFIEVFLAEDATLIVEIHMSEPVLPIANEIKELREKIHSLVVEWIAKNKEMM